MTNPPAGRAENFLRNGWMVPGWADPARVPVLLANVRVGLVWCLLYDNEDFTVLDAEQAARIRAELGLPV